VKTQEIRARQLNVLSLLRSNHSLNKWKENECAKLVRPDHSIRLIMAETILVYTMNKESIVTVAISASKPKKNGVLTRANLIACSGESKSTTSRKTEAVGLIRPDTPEVRNSSKP